MRFLHPEFGWWAVAGFATIVLLKWRVRWRSAAFTLLLPAGAFRWRASFLRRAPFAVLAVSAAFCSLAAMQPVIPLSQADVQPRGQFRLPMRALRRPARRRARVPWP